MIAELKHVEIEYTNKDVSYIEELIEYINNSSQEIIDFFSISSFGEKVKIKIWDDLTNFRNHCSHCKNNEKVPLWLCGLSYSRDKINYIDVLTLEEYKKTDKHENNTLNDLKLLIMHEFVHACHKKNSKEYTYIWLAEGLATTLSHQYDNFIGNFDATLENLINGGCHYGNYYIMFNFVLDRYGKDFIIELIQDFKKLEIMTPILYKEVKNMFCENNIKKI